MCWSLAREMIKDNKVTLWKESILFLRQEVTPTCVSGRGSFEILSSYYFLIGNAGACGSIARSIYSTFGTVVANG